MSNLYITEFGGLAPTSRDGQANAAVLPPLAQQVVVISGASAQSAAVGAQTRLLRIVSDVNCHIACSADPTATVSMLRMTADAPEYFQVPMGGAYKIAVIAGV